VFPSSSKPTSCPNRQAPGASLLLVISKKFRAPLLVTYLHVKAGFAIFMVSIVRSTTFYKFSFLCYENHRFPQVLSTTVTFSAEICPYLAITAAYPVVTFYCLFFFDGIYWLRVWWATYVDAASESSSSLRYCPRRLRSSSTVPFQRDRCKLISFSES